MQDGLPIFEFRSAPKFLAQALKNRKESVRGLSRKAGLRSPATLSQILNGKRSITPAVADRLAESLELTGNRKKYFLTLCRLSSPNPIEDQTRVEEELLKQSSSSKIEPLTAAQYRFLMHWYYVPIYVIVGLPQAPAHPRPIAEALGKGVTAAEVEKALQDLQLLGLIQKKGKGFQQAKGSFVKTSEDIQNIAIQRFHREMLSLASRALSQPVNEREISSLTVAAGEDQLPEIKARVRQFREDLDHFINQKPKKGRVYQLNIQFFPLTKPLGENQE